MAETLTPTRLRQLAEVRPEQGRVLSVFMDLDPAEFGIAPARTTQITSLITDARHQVDELDDVSHDERKALKADVETVRDTLSQPGIAAEGARGVAVFACGPAGLLEVVRAPHPLPARVVINHAPFVEPLLRAQGAERWACRSSTRRCSAPRRRPSRASWSCSPPGRQGGERCAPVFDAVGRARPSSLGDGRAPRPPEARRSTPGCWR